MQVTLRLRRTSTPCVLVAFCFAVISAQGCGENGPALPATKDVASKIVKWDQTADTSYIDWHQAREAYPTDPQYIAARSYGLSAYQRAGLTSDDYIIFDIDQELEDPLNQIADGATIYAASGGGLTKASLNAVDIISKKKMDIVVIGRCVSACVEYILPAAQSVKAFDRPVLAVHGNLGSSLDFLKKGGKFPCESSQTNLGHLNAVERQMERAKQQWKRSGHKTDFWQKQIEVLGKPELVKFESDDGDCTAIHQFEAQQYWLPTSEDFQKYLGLEFDGPLCNDSKDCLKNRLPLYFEIGVEVIVGNEAMTVTTPIFD